MVAVPCASTSVETLEARILRKRQKAPGLLFLDVLVLDNAGLGEPRAAVATVGASEDRPSADEVASWAAGLHAGDAVAMDGHWGHAPGREGGFVSFRVQGLRVLETHVDLHGDACFLRVEPTATEAERADVRLRLALQCSGNQASKLVEYCRDVFDVPGLCCNAAAALHGFADRVVLVHAPAALDLQPVLRHLHRDETLQRVLRRVFVLEPRRCWTLEAATSQLAALIAAAGSGCAVRVQVHPRYLEQRVLQDLATRGCACQARAFTHVASVVLADACYACGLAAAADEAPEPCRGLPARPRENEQVSRAYWKLQEVLLRSGWRDGLRSSRRPEGRRALDIGASPGGWSANLASAAAWAFDEVIAVDPGELAPGLLEEPDPDVRGRIQHLRCGWKEALVELLADGRPFDALVCDANVPCDQALDVLTGFLPLLSPRAYVVLTFKNCSRTRSEFERLKGEQLERLCGLCTTVREVPLLANKPLETTLLGRLTADVVAAESTSGDADSSAAVPSRCEAPLPGIIAAAA